MTLLEKIEQRATLLKQARTLIDAADAEKRSLNAEEQANWDRAMTDFDRLDAEISGEEKQIEQRSKLAAAEERMHASRGRRTEATQPGAEHRGGEAAGEFRDRFGHLPRAEFAALETRNSPEYRGAFGRYLFSGARSALLQEAEYRDMQAGADAYGGYLLAPIEYVDKLIIFKNNLVFLRELATKEVVTEAQGLGAPSLDTDVSAPVWTSEIATGNADTATRIGKRELFPHPLAKQIKLSRKLLRVNVVKAQDLVMQRLAYQYAITEENSFLNGTGAEQPLGVFTASPMGIDISRDLQTGTAGAINADDLIEVYYSLPQQYLNSDALRWIMHRTVVKTVRKLKDAEGQYIWSVALGVGRPSTLLGVEVCQSEYAPSVIASGNYAAVFGDFSFYWIADALSMTVQRLEELYAAQNQVGFIGRQETDGMPVLAAAFSRLKVK